MTDFLGQHPQVGMCRWKETHHFAGPLYWSRFGPFRDDHPSTREDYLTFFAAAQDRQRIGEASVWYLHSPTAAHDIGEFDPAADIIVMLRNPLEMLPSLHAQLVYLGIEHETDLERALARDPIRAEQGGPPGFPPDSYADAAQFASQLRRYFDVFPRNQIHVVIYDDFKADPTSSYLALCAELGIATDVPIDVSVINPRRRVRSHSLNRALGRSPDRLRGSRLGVRVHEWNTPVAATKSALSPAVVRALTPVVAQQVEELGTLLGVDLSHWLREDATMNL